MISEIDAGEGDFLTTDCTDYTDLMRGGTSALVAQRLSPRADSIRRSKVHTANVPSCLQIGVIREICG
jgi:hypothetical protein